MRFFQNPNDYTFLISRPDHRGTVSVPPHHYVEGEYYAKFSYLKEAKDSGSVPESKVVFWQSKLEENMKTAPVISHTEKGAEETEPPVEKKMVEEEVVKDPVAPSTSDEVTEKQHSLTSLRKMGKEELIELAISHGLVLTGEETKAELIEVLKP